MINEEVRFGEKNVAKEKFLSFDQEPSLTRVPLPSLDTNRLFSSQVPRHLWIPVQPLS